MRLRDPSFRITCAAILLVGLAFAGCIEAAQIDVDDRVTLGEEPDVGTLLPEALLLDGCTEHLGVFPIPYAWAGYGIPSGFRAKATGPADAFAEGTILAYACAGVAGDGFESRDLALILFGVAVIPTPEAAGEGVDAHYVVFEAQATDEDVVAVLEAWAVGEKGYVTKGAVAVASTSTPLVRHGSAAWSSTASGGESAWVRSVADGFSMETLVPVSGAGTRGSTARFYGATEGPAQAAVELTWGGATVTTTGSASLVMASGVPPVFEGFGQHRFAGEAPRLTYVSLAN